MTAINLPYNIQNGGPLDADQVMANLNAITTIANGLLEADTNILVNAPPNSNIGSVNDEGTSAYLSRADHAHIIQGVEQVAALPTSGNFLGRLVYGTAGTIINKLLMCTDAGVPTFTVFGNPAGADVAIHATEHKDGGHDPLPDGILTDHMKAARVIQSVAQGGTSADFSTSTWTNLIDLTTVATTGIQTLLIFVQGRIKNSNASANNWRLRIQDITAASAVIWETGLTDLGTGNAQDICFMFPYTVPAGGTRTLRLQGAANLANMNLFAAAATEKTLQAAIL